MSKKDEKDEKDEVQELEKIDADTQENTNTDTPESAEILLLTKKLVEQEEIVKRAQSDYFRTKMEFDEYVKRSDAARVWFELDGLIKALGKVLPFVSQLKTTLDNLPEELSSNSWAEWVSMLYSKVMNDIDTLGVKEINVELWTDPDFTRHIPIGMQETEDEAMKNKVIAVVESGYEYVQWDINKVIIPTKVMVGS